VLLCECAGTLANIDFDRLEHHAGLHADVIRGTHWCSRVGQAQMLELMTAGAEGEAGGQGARQLVVAGRTYFRSTARRRSPSTTSRRKSP